MAKKSMQEILAIAGEDGLAIEDELGNLQDNNIYDFHRLAYHLDNLKFSGRREAYECFIQIYNELMPPIKID